MDPCTHHRVTNAMLRHFLAGSGVDVFFSVFVESVLGSENCFVGLHFGESGHLDRCTEGNGGGGGGGVSRRHLDRCAENEGRGGRGGVRVGK